MDHVLLSFFTLLVFTSSVIAQQSYSGNSVLDCSKSDEMQPSSAFLYTCNGEKKSCQAFLIFIAQPPYNSVATISNLTSSDPLELARLNNVSRLTVFPTNKEVIVPIECSCSGQYYQANSSYVIPSCEDTYFTVANDTYQGLSSCQALLSENTYREKELLPGFELRVPLRCACPSRTQILKGTNFLLTYSVYWGDSVSDISKRFNVSQESVLDVNGFSEHDPTLFPFTTLLVPMPIEPSSSQTIIHSFTPSQPTFIPAFISKNHKLKKGLPVRIAIAGSSSLLVLLCIGLAVVFVYHRRKLDATRKKKKKWVMPQDLLDEIATAERVLKLFAFKELKVATNNFSPDSRMKGSVCRGELNGQVVAIKKMKNDVWKEARILNKINHFNLIRLYGVCKDKGRSYLVYEYLENGCLRNWLCSKNSPLFHSWLLRVQIALDVANGLHYLHNFTEPAYVHNDIKSSNILLNGELRAKLANFSHACSAKRMEGGFASSKFEGTIGYMAPEYLENGLVTPKIDVYAFGVVMLELLTGKNVIMLCEGKELLLSEAIMSTMGEENVKDEFYNYMDPMFGEQYPRDIALSVAKLSLACLTQNPEGRPNMDEVVSTLVKIQTDSLKCEWSYTSFKVSACN